MFTTLDDLKLFKFSRYVNTGDIHTFRPTFQDLKFTCSHNFGGYLLSIIVLVPLNNFVCNPFDIQLFRQIFREIFV